MTWNPPNLLSLLRLLLAPLVVWMILQHHFSIALGTFLIAGVSDALDGYLARRFNWTTKEGAYLDPVADKVLLVTVYLSLGAIESVPGWLVWLVLGRDVLILSLVGVGYAVLGLREFAPTFAGKVSTILQVTAAVITIAYQASVGSPLLEAFWLIAIGFAGLGTAVSGLHYMFVAVSRWQQARDSVLR